MATVEAETVRWLWRPYIPLGKVTVIEGDPGVGKSWLALAIAAAVSLGQGPPGMSLDGPGKVLILTAEDGLADTVRPRLDALGADVRQVYALDGLAMDIATITDYIERLKPHFAVFDPLVAYLGADVDLFRANEVRPLLARCAALAERIGCAIALIRHLTKGDRGHVIYRGQGTIDITAAARSVLLAGCDPDDREQRALVHIKSNLAPAGEPIGYRLTEGQFSWTGATNLTASRMLGSESNEPPSALDEALDFLRQSLSLGAQPAERVKADATALDISQGTLRRARAALGVRAAAARQEGKPGVQRWDWSLPEAEGFRCSNSVQGNEHLNPSSPEVFPDEGLRTKDVEVFG